jgi:hypothetical protein
MKHYKAVFSVIGMIVVLIMGIVIFKDVDLTVRDMVVWAVLVLLWNKIFK